MALKLVSVNIEWDRHLDTVIPFLEFEQPDVACVLELFDVDIPRIEEALGAKCFFTPTILQDTPRGRVTEGIGIFSKYELKDTRAAQYAGTPGALAVYNHDPAHWGVGIEKSMLAGGTVEKDGVSYRILATHFTWTKDGEANDRQRQDVQRLFGALSSEREFVLSGDFNAPRGKEIFSEIAARYTDNIPARYNTSLDGHLHRVGFEKFKQQKMDTYMVDGCFTSGGYRASNVHLVFGISDHAAVSAEIEKV